VHFAAGLPGVAWQPTDVDAQALASISAYGAAAALPNLLPPFELDASAPTWPLARADAVVAINLLHVAPVTVLEGLITGAGRVLAPGGVLYLYGPFKEDGRHTALSNASFDASLKAYDPAWGVRDRGEVCDLAGRHGLDLVERVAMPASNLSLVFRRKIV
jgi:SAM-dependent methyltransferase